MKRLLVVDDDSQLLRATVRQLRAALPDWEILQADQPAIAIYIASRQSYRAGDRERTNYHPPLISVVISDFQMPGYNGLRVLEEFAKHSPTTTRILSSGLVIDDIDKVDSRAETLIDFYLEKPLDIERLLRILEMEE